ncbi:MAG: hypothetical protein ACYSYM_15775 [Planctomycetota bacterium]
MSTLTKVLIVLLTIASIFLCGIVVTYVASADNYKVKYDTLYRNFRAAKASEENANAQMNKNKEDMDRQKAKLNEDIAALNTQINKLKGELANAEGQRDDARRRKDNYEAILADYGKTVEVNNQLRSDAIDTAAKIEAERTKQDKELKDTMTALIEKMAIIGVLQQQVKDLAEEKTALQEQVDRYLRQYGKVISPATPVTAAKGAVRVAPPTKDIDLKGRLTQVDLKNLLAEISIGEADGVKKGMRFHATRESKFICDVVILDVEPEKAVGWLDLLQEQPQNQPKTGDYVKTNL